ncbi:hypothetical protein U2446_15315, partial [Listeria monocytogenes]|uniref:hypothetical protein n=1 Tax=Listeria monocytogenes TaxID=1639 RepID=UPI002FDC3A18
GNVASERAREIGSNHHDWGAAMSEDVDTGRYCIDCGSQNLQYITTHANGDEYKCKDCGELHMFQEDDE